MKTQYKNLLIATFSVSAFISFMLYAEGREHGAKKMSELCENASENNFARGIILVMAPRAMQVAFDGSNAFYFSKLGALHGAESKIAECLR